MTVGDKIKSLCEKRGVSAYQLSKAIGIDHSAGYKLFHRKTIKTSTLSRIADYFGVEISDLLSDPGSESSSPVRVCSKQSISFNADDPLEILRRDNQFLKNANLLLKDKIQHYESLVEELNRNISNKDVIIHAKDQLIEILQKK